jgi:hypothetical protein
MKPGNAEVMPLRIRVSIDARRPSPDDVSNVVKLAGFDRPPILHEMVFPKIPYLHPRGSGPVKRELIMVFQK